MANPVVHFEVIGTDGAKLQAFYGEVFGWKIDANNPMQYGIVSAESGQGIGGGITGCHEGQEEATGVTVYVEVASLEQTLAEVEKRGGKTVAPPMDVPGGPRIAQFVDPQGNRIGMTQAGTGNRP